MDISNQLKQLRSRAGITQTSLAKAAKISQASVSMLEAGKREPDLSTAVRLSNALGCEVDLLVRPSRLRTMRAEPEIQALCKYLYSAQVGPEKVRSLLQLAKAWSQ